MKIIMVAAVSMDGFIADSEGRVTSWTSGEDQKFFAGIKKQHSLFVMGSGTFDAKPKEPEPGICRVVLTRHPDRYTELHVDGQLEFKDLSPKEFIEQYNRCESCLLLGGGHIYQAFIDKGLVDEIYLTREPALLGSGTPIVSTGELNLTQFDLTDSRALNSTGTVLEHYSRK